MRSPGFDKPVLQPPYPVSLIVQGKDEHQRSRVKGRPIDIRNRFQTTNPLEPGGLPQVAHRLLRTIRVLHQHKGMRFDLTIPLLSLRGPNHCGQILSRIPSGHRARTGSLQPMTMTHLIHRRDGRELKPVNKSLGGSPANQSSTGCVCAPAPHGKSSAPALPGGNHAAGTMETPSDVAWVKRIQSLLLDEIGDMTPATQAKALRLQQQQFERLGGNTTIQTDVRVIAATNRPLAQMVEEGRFRRDLFYRLNTFTIELPPLRSRTEDIPLLAQFFLDRYARSANTPRAAITPAALECLAQHSWPGNVREFASALRYAVVHAVGGVVTPEFLPDSCRRPTPLPIASSPLPSPGPHSGEVPFDLAGLVRQLIAAGQPGIYRPLTAAVDRVILDLVLDHVRGNKVQAAELLGISRQTLRSKLRSLEELDPAAASRDEFDEEPE